MNPKTNLLLALSLTLAGVAFAQNDSVKTPAALQEEIANTNAKIDGLNEDYLATKATVDGLSKLKFGGYIQAQWQHTSDYGIRDSAAPGDTSLRNLNGAGTPTVAGGSFPGQSNQRFQVRRARLKATYTNGDAKYVLEFDALPSGLSVKDAYVQLNEPWLNTFSLTMGNMDMPFGYEIGYSSGAMESPERSRLENNIFKGEKQLGAKIEINPTEKMGLLQYLNLKTGLYTGTEGGTGGTGDEVDNGLESISRLGFKAPFNDLGLDIDGGVSFLFGKTQTGFDTVYVDSANMFIPEGKNKPRYGEWKYFDRKIFGVDAQAYYDVPVVGGFSLRGEYVWGRQPGTAGSLNPYTNAGVSATANSAAMYLRDFKGFYVQVVQNLGPKLQFVGRFDEFDPNTKVSGSAIGDSSSFSAAGGSKLGIKRPLTLADLKYDTWGVGLTYYWSGNLKFLVYYDMPTNEKISATGPSTSAATSALAAMLPYQKDIKDNVLTLRMQVKF